MSPYVSQNGGNAVHFEASTPRNGVVQFDGSWIDADVNTWTFPEVMISADDAVTVYNQIGDVLRSLNKL